MDRKISTQDGDMLNLVQKIADDIKGDFEAALETGAELTFQAGFEVRVIEDIAYVDFGDNTIMELEVFKKTFMAGNVKVMFGDSVSDPRSLGVIKQPEVTQEDEMIFISGHVTSSDEDESIPLDLSKPSGTIYSFSDRYGEEE